MKAEETTIDVPIEQALLAINTMAPADYIAQVQRMVFRVRGDYPYFYIVSGLLKAFGTYLRSE